MVPITFCLSDFAKVDVQQGCWHSEKSPTFPSCKCPSIFSSILTLCPLMMNCVRVVYCNTVHFLLYVVGVCYVQATDLYNSQQSADPAV